MVLCGLFSAGLLVAALFALRSSGHEGYTQLEPSLISLRWCADGGEVRDLWVRRLERLQMANEYRQYRLDESCSAPTRSCGSPTTCSNSAWPAATRACAVRCLACVKSCAAFRSKAMR